MRAAGKLPRPYELGYLAPRSAALWREPAAPNSATEYRHFCIASLRFGWASSSGRGAKATCPYKLLILQMICAVCWEPDGRRPPIQKRQFFRAFRRLHCYIRAICREFEGAHRANKVTYVGVQRISGEGAQVPDRSDCVLHVPPGRSDGR